MNDYHLDGDSDLRAAITERLSRSVLGLSTQDIARSLSQGVPLVSTTLLSMQREGLVTFRQRRWELTHKPPQGVPKVSSIAPALKPTVGKPPGKSVVQPVSAPQAGQGVTAPRSGPASQPADSIASTQIAENSRWATFRRLCLYYAECVRLDQGTTIHGKDRDENEKFVCLSGRLDWAEATHPPEMTVSIPVGWSQFVQGAKKVSHLFLGAPLNRFKWRGASAGEHVVFVSPVFLAPVEFEICQTNLRLRLLGPIRINDGWLEKRLSDPEERRVFLELCGLDLDESDERAAESFYRSFRPFCGLLSHFYPSWCQETLDVSRLTTGPEMKQLRQDGIYNRAALFLPGKLQYTGRLHQELLRLAWYTPDEDFDRSALRHVFPHKPSAAENRLVLHGDALEEGRPVGRPSNPGTVENNAADASKALESLVHLATVEPLNEEQVLACHSGVKDNLSVIVGPPGTGKSRVVQAVLAQAALAGRSALFASRNHQALEAVVPRLNALVEPAQVILRLARPFGQGGDVGLQQALADLLNRPSLDDAIERRDIARRRLVGLLGRLERVRSEVQRFQQLQLEMTDAERLLAENQADLPSNAAEVLPEALGLPSAVEIADLIGILGPAPPFRFSFHWLIAMLRRWFLRRAAVKRAAEVDRSFRATFSPVAPSAPSLSAVPSSDPTAIVSALQKWLPYATAIAAFARVQTLRRDLECLENPELLYERYQAAVDQAVLGSRDCLQAVADAWGVELSADERSRLMNLLAGVKNYSPDSVGVEQKQLAALTSKASPILVKHVPLLATTNLSAGRHLAWAAGLFDLLIIDEASQCDIASVIPLLFRCRRAMFVGDPMQLSHVTRISGGLDTQLRRQFQLLDENLVRFSYRATSAFHLAVGAEQLSRQLQLRQHHRCHPRIARYCNTTFYCKTLVVMTDEAHRSGEASGLLWTDVPADAEAVAGGGAISRAQLRAIVDELGRLAREQFAGTVGVVTPFRQQANRIRDAIWQEIDHAALSRWRLLVDTADGFQGDERHVVLFSLVGGPEMTPGALRFLTQTPNRFNVAVSRAMRLLHVFGDLDWANQCGAAHIRRLALACSQEPPSDLAGPAELIGPVWEPRLADALSAAGLPFQQQYPACGRYLDFALMKPGLKLNVEVDGEAYHRGPDGLLKREDLERDLVLVANGWTVMRFWVYQLRENMPACIERIRSRFHGL